MIREFDEYIHFSDLPHLVYLKLGNNLLLGRIRSSIGVVAKLAYLDLSVNNLDGSIPTFIGNCTKPSSLDLSYFNSFSTMSVQ